MRGRLCQGLLCCWIALAWSSQLAAQAQRTRNPAQASEQAGMEARAGEAAYALGDFAGALRAFERAYAGSKEPRMLFRIGDVADKLGMYARAASAFQAYLRAAPASKDHAFVASRMRANQVALGGAAERESASRAPAAPLQAAAVIQSALASTAPSAFTAAAARERGADDAPSNAGRERPANEARERPADAARERAVTYASAPPRDTGAVAEREHARSHDESASATDARQHVPRAALGGLAHAESSGTAPRVGPWWLWAGAGTLVVAGIVIAALSLGSATTSPDPLRGNLGSAVQTLMRP
jgi:tetratricopeptide (TPR) repeat protein